MTRPDPMATCPHNQPAGTRCVDCGDLFNYEFAYALRRLAHSMVDVMPRPVRRLLGR